MDVKNDRLLDKKYLIGESYGGYRGPRIVHYLQSTLGVAMNGVVLVSPYLNPAIEENGDISPVPWMMTLPSIAAAHLEREHKLTPEAMREVLARGDNLILFPEGTSSDGSRVLPFRSSFFALAEGKTADPTARAPLIQPVSVVYDRLNGLPAGRSSRPVFAWYGDMDIASHFWRMTQHLDMRVTVLLHAPLDPAMFPDRKSLSRAVWQTVADGAAMLRQNRPARPLSVAPRRPDDVADREPAFA